MFKFQSEYAWEIPRMKKSIQIALALAGALTFSQAINAADVTSIAPFGEDGEDSFYQIACSNQTVGSVVVHAKPKQLCDAPYRHA